MIYRPFKPFAFHVKIKCLLVSHVQLFATPRTVACQAPLSMGFSRHKYCSGVPCPPHCHIKCVFNIYLKINFKGKQVLWQCINIEFLLWCFNFTILLFFSYEIYMIIVKFRFCGWNCHFSYFFLIIVYLNFLMWLCTKALRSLLVFTVVNSTCLNNF